MRKKYQRALETVRNNKSEGWKRHSGKGTQGLS